MILEKPRFFFQFSCNSWTFDRPFYSITRSLSLSPSLSDRFGHLVRWPSNDFSISHSDSDSHSHTHSRTPDQSPFPGPFELPLFLYLSNGDLFTHSHTHCRREINYIASGFGVSGFGAKSSLVGRLTRQHRRQCRLCEYF